jgi:hypothetical protein
MGRKSRFGRSLLTLARNVDFIPPDSEAIRISSYCDKRGGLVSLCVYSVAANNPGINHEMRRCFFQWVVACRKPPIDEASLESVSVSVRSFLLAQSRG